VSNIVLLDRDGIINQRGKNGYVTSCEEFVFLPDALDALRLLFQNDFLPVIISNQSCVGKGLLAPSALDRITRWFVEIVERNGGRIHAVYYCPHREEDGCDCRKPKPGLLLRAQKELRFEPAETFFVGDSESDLLAAHAVGCPAVLVLPEGGDGFPDAPHRPQAIFRSLYPAAEFLVNRRRMRRDASPVPGNCARG
jgi:histidinol-phosphate phosphatase family protein